MLLVKRFEHPEPKSREHNAVARAIDVKPEVVHLYTDNINREAWYLCRRSDKISKHIVYTFEDRENRLFIQCDCMAGTPPVDSVTRLPVFEPIPCLHVASVLIAIAEESNLRGDDDLGESVVAPTGESL